ncbi:VOC family protein [Falsiroseomonas tokyonensis]|uniref:VOC family protein n=1 Tax=Falsiroseomonas tokyonensis TaxID=430521 RepID=A0ABV7BM74_9PROT|nr:VOC family protein [Falsiroseomonas tokyonensis]MBU8536673.1 VOC family protein [Falsiroseomonas tokyonensis]
MALRHVIGVDHVVVAVRDLDAAAAAWRALGFTVSPRGTHSAHMGSGNYTIMFGEDYLELLGVLTPTEHNAPMRAFLEKREGLDRAAFTTDDAAAGAEELRAKGIAAIGPIAFGRPVTLPGGGEAEARFQVFQWPREARPAGLGIFACQHLTRENVWIPELQSHANGASRLLRIEVLAADPKAGAEELARLIDRVAEPEADGAWRVASGAHRADFVFLDRATLAARHPGVALDGLPEQGAAALVLGTADLPAAAKALGVSAGGTVAVPPARANGLLLRFEAA